MVNDTVALLDALGDDAAASDGPYGLCGLLHERRLRDGRGRHLCPDRFAANVSLYGVYIVTENEIPRTCWPRRSKGEMYYAFAEHDRWVPMELIDTLRATLTSTVVTHEIESFPTTEHGFAFPEREVYHEPSAEIVWEKMFRLYARVLG